MQTFLPFDSYGASARVLDQRRLGKQRVEVLQMLSAILDPSAGWQQHPAVTMWRGHGAALATYGLVVCEEWTSRGYKDTCFKKIRGMLPLAVLLGERIEFPQWWGDDAVHSSHRDALFSKDPDYYGEHFEPDREFTAYVWPPGRERVKTSHEKDPVTTSELICRRLPCGRRPGFTNIGTNDIHWWVCATCRRPTEAWFIRQGDEMLNMFRGGMLDGMVYESKTLLGDSRLATTVLGYSYTTEILTGQSGRQARVWLSTEQPGSVAQVAQTLTPIKENKMSTVEAPEPTTDTAETTETATVVETVDTSDLLDRRNALKLSRTKVADAAGITVAQLYRIETGGKRTTADEAANVRNALVQLEAAVPAPEAEAADPS